VPRFRISHEFINSGSTTAGTSIAALVGAISVMLANGSQFWIKFFFVLSAIFGLLAVAYFAYGVGLHEGVVATFKYFHQWRLRKPWERRNLLSPDNDVSYRQSHQPGTFRVSYANPSISEPLADFIQRIQTIKGMTVKTDEDYEQWKNEYQTLSTDVDNFLRRSVSYSAAMRFKDLDIIASAKVKNSYNEEHNKFLNLIKRQEQELRYEYGKVVD
jgi:hypothetical protein